MVGCISHRFKTFPLKFVSVMRFDLSILGLQVKCSTTMLPWDNHGHKPK